MSSSDQKLRPCSRCGSTTMRELHTVHKKNGSVMYFGQCACGCKTHPYMTVQRAIDAWNAKYDRYVFLQQFKTREGAERVLEKARRILKEKSDLTTTTTTERTNQK